MDSVGQSSGLRPDKLRIYRNVMINYQKLNKIYQSARRPQDLFKPRTVQLRQELRQQAEQLLFNETSDYGRKAEEVMWRAMYHEVMQAYKKYKATIKAREFNLLVSHFQSAIGHYYGLLLMFVTEYDLKLHHVLPELQQLCSIYEDDLDQSRANQRRISSDVKMDSVKQCVHRILIYLGDIYRYLDHLSQNEENCRLQAKKWYNSAILLDPKAGMPFNQLGTLALNDNYNLDSVYYYLRCLMSPKSFSGAESNLKVIFNGAILSAKDNASNSTMLKPKASESVQIVRRCLIDFIATVGEFWNRSIPLYNLQSKIVNSVSLIKAALALPVKGNSSPGKPTCLDASLVFQMTSILLMLIDNTKSSKRSSSDKNGQQPSYDNLLNSALVAFTLNFFYFVVSTSVASVRSKKIIDEKQLDRGETSKHFEISPRQAVSHLRRKRATIRFDNQEDEEEDEFDQLEETALSTIDALEMSSDLSETGSICDEYEEEESSNSMATSEEDNSQQNSQSTGEQKLGESNNNNVYDIRKLLVHLYYESNLPTIKVLCSWLMTNPSIFQQHFEALSALMTNFVDLFNVLLNIEEKAVASDLATFDRLRYTSNKWTQKYPLSIDTALIGFSQLKPYFSKNIDFTDCLNHQLADDQMGFLCVESIISFGHFLSSSIAKQKIMYDCSTRKFIATDEPDKILSSNGCNSKITFSATKQQGSPSSNSNSITTKSSSASISKDSCNNNNVSAELNNSQPLFDFGNPTFLKNSLSFIGDFGRQRDESIIPNMAYLWLDNDNNNSKLASDQTARMSPPKDFCPSRALSA